MIEKVFEGIESVRVMRAQANLTIAGIEAFPLRISSELEPDVRRTGATAEFYLAGDTQLGIPPGVSLEVVDCAGHLEVENFGGNFSIGRIAGNLRVAKVGSIAIRGNIESSCYVESAAAVSGRCVKGELLVDGARSVAFDLVGGDLICVDVAGDAAVEQIGGRCSLERIGGQFRSHTVGGKLEAEHACSLDVDTVGSKLRASQVAQDVSVKTVGGKVSVDGAANVSIATVGGHLSLRAIRGSAGVARVGGAARLGGDFAPGSSWRVKSGGRLLVELKSTSSVALEADARHGRVRVHGIEGELRFAGRDRLSAGFGAGECKLSLETAGSDIIIEGEEARGRYAAGERIGWRDLGAPFEDFAENLSAEIPGVVAEIVGAAGRIVAETGTLSGGLVRGVTRGVGDAMREVEHEINELKREVPEQAADKLSRLGRRIGELVNETIELRRRRSREEAERIRERVREEAHRIREAAREARRGAHQSAPRPDEPAPGSAPNAADESKPQSPDPEILTILAAVRAGELDPQEADDLIRALLEVEASERSPKPAA